MLLVDFLRDGNSEALIAAARTAATNGNAVDAIMTTMAMITMTVPTIERGGGG